MQQANLKSLRKEFFNPYARMLPLQRKQAHVYQLADKNPPGLEGYQPRWEVVNAVLGAQQQIQVRVDLMTDYHLLALLCSASANTVGAFRVQIYDQLKQRTLTDRGLQFALFGGALSGNAVNGPVFLREPYAFDLPRSQALVILTNLEPTANTVQIALYGLAAPFTGRLSNE